MKNVEPHVFITTSTKINEPGMREWLDYVGAKDFRFSEPSTDAEKIVMAYGKRCYMSFVVGLNPNIVKVREDMTAFIDNILTSKHGSVLAHVHYGFAIEGVSRVFTAEWNRHRVGVDGLIGEDEDLAISEGSMRYIRFDDIPFWMPNSLRDKESDSDVVRGMKAYSRTIFTRAFSQGEENYKELLNLWNLDNMQWRSEDEKKSVFAVKKELTSCFRRIIPIGVATGGAWTGGLRALRNIFTQRCTPEAEEEILLVACIMLKKMRDYDPLFFADFREENGFWYPAHYKV